MKRDLISRLSFQPFAPPQDGAAALLERELAAKNYRVQTIAMGANTDPYQPIERQYRITRSILETLAKYDEIKVQPKQ